MLGTSISFTQVVNGFKHGLEAHFSTLIDVQSNRCAIRVKIQCFYNFIKRRFSTVFINPLKSLGSPDRMLIIHSAMSQIVMTLETCRFSSGVDHCIKSRAKNASEARARI